MSIRRVLCVGSVVVLCLGTLIGSDLLAPAAGAAGTTTLQFYSLQRIFTSTDAAGQPLSPHTVLTVGDRYDSTDLYYVGNHQHHAASFSGSDHLACVVTMASSVAERQSCNDQFDLNGLLLLSNDVTVTFQGMTASIPISAGIGKYKNAAGMLVSKHVGKSMNTDNTFTLTGVGSGPTVAVPVSPSTILHFYSVQETYTLTSPTGQPISTNSVLDPGESYDTTDLYYLGNHEQHASRFSGSDHQACIFGVTTQACNSEIAIGGSMLVFNDVTENGIATGSASTVSAPISEGTGRYENTRGTFESGAGDNVDVTVTLTG